MLKSNITEYNKVNHANSTDDVIKEFLGEHMKVANFSNQQYFNYEGLKGRLLSSSYCPVVGEDGHAEIMIELQKLFKKHEADGSVRFDYRTQAYSV